MKSTIKELELFIEKVSRPDYIPHKQFGQEYNYWTNGAINDLKDQLNKLKRRWWLNWL